MFEGYAPLFVYIGQEGYWLNLDFRSGKRHSQCKGTVEFLTETLNSFHRTHFKRRHRIRRRRLRSVIQDLIYLAARLIRHARG